jgi:hypothetical protein
MKKILLLILCTYPLWVACDKCDEVPPVADKIPSGYRLPDPTPLSEQDRQVIDEMETEFNDNVKP